MSKEITQWEDAHGNGVILGGVMGGIYLKMPKPMYNGGHPDKYFTVKATGSASYCYVDGKEKSRTGFDNPHNPLDLSRGGFSREKVSYHNGHVYRNGDSVCLTFESGDPVILNNPKRLDALPENIVPLPSIRVKDYLLYDSAKRNGLFIYVSRDKYKYDPVKFFFGICDNMFEYKILDFTRYRDGGTTKIKTEEGILHIPTPFNKERIITFNDKEFWECPDKWEVNETDSCAEVIF